MVFRRLRNSDFVTHSTEERFKSCGALSGADSSRQIRSPSLGKSISNLKDTPVNVLTTPGHPLDSSHVSPHPQFPSSRLKRPYFQPLPKTFDLARLWHPDCIVLRSVAKNYWG